ncbi:MAG: OmpH family outer membrane protein [Candidatus Omnitrophica bacterium]|nr:OmpH family outer membrane protein [Candidatus Omnitrophota bacterium]MBU4589695.1 OmpH family outer membrane protein [Candidatus Omnitrophota bacterium]
MRIIFTLTLISMFLFSGLAFAQSDTKIGYVDLSRAFDEYQKTKDFDKELEKTGDIKQGQREKLVKEIRNMRDELELMNDSARKKKEGDIEAKIRLLQEFDQDAKAELTKERDDMVRDILKEMNGVIQEYGKGHGYSIIVNDRVLLYGSDALDLTDEVIKILNEGYKK